MDKIIKKAEQIKNELYNLEEFKEYFKYKEQYENSEYLIKLRKEIANCKNKEKHDKLLQEFNNDPIVINYRNYKDEVASILRTIKNLID